MLLLQGEEIIINAIRSARLLSHASFAGKTVYFERAEVSACLLSHASFAGWPVAAKYTQRGCPQHGFRATLLLQSSDVAPAQGRLLLSMAPEPCFFCSCSARLMSSGELPSAWLLRHASFAEEGLRVHSSLDAQHGFQAMLLFQPDSVRSARNGRGLSMAV